MQNRRRGTNPWARSWESRVTARQLIAYAIIAIAILIVAIAILSRRRRKPPTHERIDLFRDES